ASLGALDPESAVFLASFGAMTPQEAFALTKRGGRQVTIVEMLPRVGADLGLSTRWVVLKELRLHGVQVITDARVEEINQKGVVVANKEGEKRLVEADTVVLAAGVRARNGLYEQVKGLVPEAYLVGDGVKPRRLMDAIHEGARAALEI
ncbi:MAG TPA: FAD-dependent oxidoreductase, partial [Dehalococcoidia bacterium]|nr:FAD-dependent oxidoreductase [Dehalococcoidia bacterium]